MLKALKNTVVAAVLAGAVWGVASPAAADTQLSYSGKSSNSFLREPGADCVKSATSPTASSYSVTVRPPSVEGYPGYNSQTVGWRPVLYRWNGSQWVLALTGSVYTGTTTPRGGTGNFVNGQRFSNLPPAYYMATVETFWYKPGTSTIEGREWSRVDTVTNSSVSPIGVVTPNVSSAWCAAF